MVNTDEIRRELDELKRESNQEPLSSFAFKFGFYFTFGQITAGILIGLVIFTVILILFAGLNYSLSDVINNPANSVRFK